ncbi:MAG TPA: ribosome-binding factor A [Candidatus Bathyarchaeia archaeon]|nr:ribosome-binding factor A [Candidatus Bathyarchaeia archaeon]
MNPSKLRSIKHAQRESFFLKEISQFFLPIILDNPSLQSLCISRVALSSDKGLVAIYFYSPQGQPFFEQKLSELILYKPSLRAALAKIFHGPYAPELVFRYDETLDKERKINELIEQLKRDNKL